MKAMILAAGLGTRLKPITNHTPKALLNAGPYTLLQFAILKLRSFGFNEMIINVHHHPDAIIDYLKKNNNFGCSIAISDEREKLLDTGGGIKKASWYFSDNEPFIVYNADIITDLDLQLLYRFHLESLCMATLVVRQRKTSRYLLFDKNLHLKGWENVVSGEKLFVQETNEALNPFAFSGVHVINPEIFKLMDSADSFSIIKTYLKVGATYPIGGFVDKSVLWADAGKPESLTEAGQIASKIRF